jgi:hypothetical protein
MRKQVEVLEHHADLAANLVDLLQIVGQLDAVDDDLALLVFFQPVDAADHGRLARTGRPGNDDALAAHHLEVDVAQHVEIAIPLVHVRRARWRHRYPTPSFSTVGAGFLLLLRFVRHWLQFLTVCGRCRDAFHEHGVARHAEAEDPVDERREDIAGRLSRATIQSGRSWTTGLIREDRNRPMISTSVVSLNRPMKVLTMPGITSFSACGMMIMRIICLPEGPAPSRPHTGPSEAPAGRRGSPPPYRPTRTAQRRSARAAACRR